MSRYKKDIWVLNFLQITSYSVKKQLNIFQGTF